LRALLAALLLLSTAAAAQVVPVPPPAAVPAAPVPPPHPLRPPAESAPTPTPSARPRAEPAPPAPLADGEHEACLIALRAAGVVFEPLPAIAEGRCGAPRPLRVMRIGDVALNGPATMICRTALALSGWVREDLVPAAGRHMRAPLTELRVGGSYECRNRNRTTAGPTSEHAFANAVDIMGFAFRGADPVSVAAPGARGAPFLAEARTAACRRFTTVLGPGSDAAHADHIHVDLKERRGGYRMCQ
jgi:hypothetical protein